MGLFSRNTTKKSKSNKQKIDISANLKLKNLSQMNSEKIDKTIIHPTKKKSREN